MVPYDVWITKEAEGLGFARSRKAGTVIEAILQQVKSLRVPDDAYLEVPLLGVLRSRVTLYFLKPDIKCIESAAKQANVAIEVAELKYMHYKIPAVILRGYKRSIERALELLLGNISRCTPLRHPSIRGDYRFFAALPADIRLTVEIVKSRMVIVFRQ